jgi:hypothetical protein
MSHVAHHSPTVVHRAAGRAFKLTLAALLAAGIAVALILLIGGDKTAPITSPAPVSSVARPDEGLAPITKPASSVTSLFVYPKGSPAAATSARPDEGLAPIAPSTPGTSQGTRPDEGASALRSDTGITARYEAWNQRLGVHR